MYYNLVLSLKSDSRDAIRLCDCEKASGICVTSSIKDMVNFNSRVKRICISTCFNCVLILFYYLSDSEDAVILCDCEKACVMPVTSSTRIKRRMYEL